MQPGGVAWGQPPPPQSQQPPQQYWLPGWGVAPLPRPRGPPTRFLFIIGAVGHFFSAAASVPFAVFGFGLGGLFFFRFFFFEIFLFLILGVLYFVGLLLHLFGFYGFWRNYGSQMGIATFAYGLAAVVIFLVGIVLGVIASFSFFLLTLVGFVALGVLFIVDGVTYIVVRHSMINLGTSIAAGVLFIVSGAFVCSLFLSFVGGIIAVPAFILGGIILLRSPMPGALPFPAPYAIPGPPFWPPTTPP